MKKMKHEEVEIQITPMLDMAFQLLTFFIMTYHPAPAEGQFSMNLLPASPQAKLDAPAADTSAPADPNVPAALRTMKTTLHAAPSGALGRVTVGEVEVQGMDQLRAKLKEILADKSLPFDQALIQADPQLRYEDLMRVVDIYSNLNITKISFAQMEDGGGGGPGAGAGGGL
jgi:biopolymer transport protein ExbD